LEAAAPPGNLDPTSRSQTFLSMCTLKENYAVIPMVTFSLFTNNRGLLSDSIQLFLFCFIEEFVAPTKISLLKFYL